MTRNQFLTDAEEYLGRIEGNVSESTFKEKQRKLILYGKILYNMAQQKTISTCNPRKMKPEDINEYVGYRRSLGVMDTTIHKDLTMIGCLLDYVGNNAMRTYRTLYYNKKPRNYLGRLDPLPDRTIELIYDLARKTDSWKVLQGCVAVILGCASGLRPQESRQLYVYDVHLEGPMPKIFIEHVKGEGTWGRRREVPINDGVTDILQKYLVKRQERLDRRHVYSDAMFPSFREGSEFVTQQSMSRFRGIVVKALRKEGVKDFSLRDGRRAFGQRMLDRGVPLEHVSYCMGHDSIETTQKYYANYKSKFVLESVYAQLKGTQPPRSDPGL